MDEGEVAWRITDGPYKGRLCWLNAEALAVANKRNLFEVQLVQENVPHYGLWGGETVRVKPTYLKKVRVVTRWSDEV